MNDDVNLAESSYEHTLWVIHNDSDDTKLLNFFVMNIVLL